MSIIAHMISLRVPPESVIVSYILSESKSAQKDAVHQNSILFNLRCGTPSLRFVLFYIRKSHPYVQHTPGLLHLKRTFYKIR